MLVHVCLCCVWVWMYVCVESVCVCGSVLCLSWHGLPVCRVMQNGQCTCFLCVQPFLVCFPLGPLNETQPSGRGATRLRFI